MNSTPRLVVLALSLLVLFSGCGEDEELPPKPELPEQIEYSVAYVRGTNGLPHSEVTSFLVMTNGEMWIGTQAGLARYASTGAKQSFEIVNEINGLPHPQVRDMVEHNGEVYVATWGGGLGVYDIGADTWSQIRPGATGLTDGFIASAASSPTEDPARVYFASNDGVFIYDPTADSFTHFSTVDDDLDPEDFETPALQKVVSSVAVHEEAGVVQRWYGPRVEVRVPQDKLGLHGITVNKVTNTFKYTSTNSGLTEPNVNDIYFDTQTNTFWIAYVAKGISQVDVDASSWKSYTLVQGLPSNTVYAVTRAGDNESANTVMWAATQDGLAKLVGNNWESYGVASGLPSQRIRTVFSDNGQRLWVGFVDAGAVRILN